jgi:dipeptidyl aminopeptidase/acylaminoacyl peptidase
MDADTHHRTVAALRVAALLAAVAAAFPSQATAASGTGPAVREISIAYRAFDGRLSHAVVLLPRWYGPQRQPALPLVISPHGRGLDGRANARRWGNLPALGGGFVVVNPDGEGLHLDGRFSWGAPGQIDDLARMPELVRAALPWLRLDPRRIFAVGGSMGGEETLLLVARHPRLLAGAVAVDPVVDLARQFRSSEGSRGAELRRLAQAEAGGTPSTDPAAFAARSPITYAAAIAASGVPLQIWWTRTDRIVVHSELQSGLLVTRLRQLGPRAALQEVAGDWRHTAVLRADRSLPAMLAGLGLLAGDRA